MKNGGKTIVISIGGSIIVPDKVDYDFLKQLKTALEKLCRRYKIVICTGGGAIARDYIRVLAREGLNEYTQDLVGIAVTRLNAKLVASFMQYPKRRINCNTEIPTTLEEIAELLRVHNLVVCGGLAPGRTSDGTTASIAEYLNADTMINVTNVKGLYDKDPRTHKDAKFIPRISHKDFAKMMSAVKEMPGQHFVLDSVAAEITRKAGIKVIILKGVNNLERYLLGKRFVGTVVF